MPQSEPDLLMETLLEGSAESRGNELARWGVPVTLFAVAGLILVGVARRRGEDEGEPSEEPDMKPARPSSASGPAPALVRLLKQVNEAYPSRGKASDGIMASEAHKAAAAAAGRKDDHAAGDALDITRDEQNGPDLVSLRDALIQDPRVTYIILDRKIISRVVQPFVLRDYNGPNPHTKHIHISVDHAQRDDASDWDIHKPAAG